ncbi:MAG: nucleotidyltransferase domain-containing protein [Armatimonadota bacterium]
MRKLSRVKILNSDEKEMLLKVKSIVTNYDSEAEIILYGSAARCKREKYSDYDILIITQKQLSFNEERKLISEIYDIQLEKEVVFSININSSDFWYSPKMSKSPYKMNVISDGILV